jgi:hypothetical protein
MRDPYRGPSPPPHDDPVAHLLGRLAWLMDRAFTVPGTRVQVGLDALFGLLPLAGDLLTGLVQTGLVLIALGRYRVPPEVAARMMANVLLDIGVGSIPLLGDLFDVAFKANTRNMVLLEPYIGKPGPKVSSPSPDELWTRAATPIGTSWGCIVVIAVALLAALTLVLIGFVTVVRWMVRAA